MTKGEFYALKRRLMGKHKDRYDHKSYRMVTGYKSPKRPGTSAARNKASRAVKMGFITPTPCQYCGESDAHKHHHNGYENPLDVIFVCRSCHHRLHGRNTEGRKILGISSDVRRVHHVPEGRTAVRTRSVPVPGVQGHDRAGG